ncbi:protein kinase-1 [Operophtera brumata nucleopolyhedrovirus]|uniref:non-specific serine/threonine protein kinase n=1 Tax=Operophtera brumata nucleopolyhedrovirus TaxID=1046267 RepID=A0A2H4UZL5_9ABAC|nr:protein kinase-1 [Operophtera brumata nucleopolyhedrovirus]AUA60234.1 protein kinase-1 [Operophtera brumata nucleopolyhedrovirus]
MSLGADVSQEVAIFFNNLQPVRDRVIEDGKFGNVAVVQHKTTKKRYFIKKIRFDKYDPVEPYVHDLMRDHKNFINKRYLTCTDKYHVIVQDYFDHKDLWEMRHTIKDVYVVKSIIIQLINGLNALHQHCIIHNDIKLENLLYSPDTNTLKIVDYGMCRNIGRKTFQDGTIHYFSPEKLSNRNYQHSDDWWAVGVVTYELLSGKHPFCDDDYVSNKDMYSLLMNTRIENIPRVSKLANKFVSAMLLFSYPNRLKEYREIIRHDFLK